MSVQILKTVASHLPKLSSLELCTGAGGLALGISRTGFEHKAVVEVDQACCKTLNLNKEANVDHVKNWTIEESDISEFDFHGYEDVDLVGGGPPCQPL